MWHVSGPMNQLVLSFGTFPPVWQLSVVLENDPAEHHLTYRALRFNRFCPSPAKELPQELRQH